MARSNAKYCRTIKRQFLTLVITTIISIILNSSAMGQFVEDYGSQGRFRAFKGQIRTGAEEPIPFGKIYLTNVRSKQEFTVDSDGDGIFSLSNLPKGNYSAEVRHPAFNLLTFSFKIDPVSKSASRKYIVLGLSPGCASGGFGVRLVSKLETPSDN